MAPSSSESRRTGGLVERLLAPSRSGVGGSSPSLHDASLEELAAELESRLGFCPSLYRVAEAYPAASWGLYEFAKATYVANPLPQLLKEQLFTYLSRFCRIPYCLARHATFLASLRSVADAGSPALTDVAIERLLSEPLPTAEQSAATLEALRQMMRPVDDWPTWSSAQGEILKQACVQLFTRPVPARAWLIPLRRWLGAERFEQLTALLTFIRTAHYWTKLHPDIAWEPDVAEFVERHPQIGRFFQPANVDWEYPAGPGEWERQQADAATWKANHEFAHRVIDNLYTFVGVLDLDGRVLFANRAPLQAAALEPTQVIGQFFWDCAWWNYDPEVSKRLREAYARSRAGELVRYDVPVLMAENRRMWIDFQLSPLRDDAGQITHVIASAMDISHRHSIEEKLAASEERLRLAAGAAGFGMYSFDAADGTLVWSDRMREIFLLPDDMPPSMEFLAQSFHEDDREVALQKVAAGIDPTGDGVLDHEHRIVRPDGSLRWVAVRGRTEFVDGQVARSFGAVLDVTDQRSIVQALRDSETRFRQLFENAPTGIGIATRDGLIVEMNAAFGDLLGYPPADLIGRDFRTLQHPEDLDRNLAEVDRVLSNEISFAELESRYVRRDGQSVWVHKLISVLRDEAGAPAYFMVLVTDITQRREAEHRIRESEQRMRLAIEGSDGAEWQTWIDPSTPCGIATLAPIDPRQKRFIGYADDEFPNDLLAWQERIHPDDAARMHEGFVAHLSGQTPFFSAEYRVRHRNGSWRWILALGRMEPPNADSRQCVAGVSWDVTERKQAEAELRAADRRKDEFLATLAHELRNPLAPISSAVEILRLRDSAEPAQRRALDIVDRQLQHMVRLIDDLLDVSRISRMKLTLRRERVTLASVLDQALETVRPHLVDARHRLTWSLPSEPIWLDADPVRMAQVFANLLNNAAKYTDPGGEIGVEARCSADAVKVVVRDNGIGIAPEFHPHLFRQFAQATPALERSQGGLGIGLPLVHGLVTMHGGRIEAFSEGPGCGSEFCVTLPTTAAPDEGLGLDDDAPKSFKTAPSLRIVIADDNRDAAESLALVLQVLGHRVRKAFDGQQAIDAVAELQPHLALIDIGMPHMNGYEVAQRIRREPWGQDVKLYAVTGWGQESDRQRSLESGFDGHLVKPLNQAVVGALLEGVPTTEKSARE